MCKKLLYIRSGKRQDKKVDVIKIDKGKIMVVLTNEDMAKYHIGSDAALGEEPEVSDEALRRIARDAAASVGEDMCGGRDDGAPRMLIRMFASKGGGCEMFITQLPCGEYTQPTEQHVHRSQKHIYMFDSMENLLAACRKLMCAGGVGESRLWADNERRAYYLELGEERVDMCEFGAVRLYGGAKYYLAEHCRLICTDAVRRMGTLA